MLPTRLSSFVFICERLGVKITGNLCKSTTNALMILYIVVRVMIEVKGARDTQTMFASGEMMANMPVIVIAMATRIITILGEAILA